MSSRTNLGCNFYAESGQNKTKITTVFHFGSDIYGCALNNNPIYSNGATHICDTFEQLLEWYNNASKINEICLDDVCHIFIKECTKINIIDTIGKSDIVNDEYHENITKLIKTLYPNNINIHIVREPSRNLDFSGKCLNVRGFADTIDYTHFGFMDVIEKGYLLFFSNIEQHKLMTIKTKQVQVYGIDTIVEIMDHAANLSKLDTTTRNIEHLHLDAELINAKCIEEFMNILKKYNNSELYEYINAYLLQHNYSPLNEMNDAYNVILTDRDDKQGPGYGPVRLIGIMKSHIGRGNKWIDKILDEKCTSRIQKRLSNYVGKDFSKFDRDVDLLIKNKSLEFVSRDYF